jgi:putative redox protein
MKVSVEWSPPTRFAGLAESQAQAVMAERPTNGEVPPGPSPMEAVLMALCSCAGLDIVAILQKMRAPLADLHIEADAERSADPPRVFTKIHLRVHVRGEGLLSEQVERAVTLSVDKYCSVAAMLKHTAEITHEIILREV